jgi:hypothetical protein
MTGRIKTLHPDPSKSGVSMEQAKYEKIRAAIVQVLQTHEHLNFTELTHQVTQLLDGKFTGSIGWYTVSVKLDLEARGLIERIPKTRPEQLRLVKTD